MTSAECDVAIVTFRCVGEVYNNMSQALNRRLLHYNLKQWDDIGVHDRHTAIRYILQRVLTTQLNQLGIWGMSSVTAQLIVISLVTIEDLVLQKS